MNFFDLRVFLLVLISLFLRKILQCSFTNFIIDNHMNKKQSKKEGKKKCESDCSSVKSSVTDDSNFDKD